MEAVQKKTAASWRQQKILVVEKSPLARQLITDVLHNAGYEVIVAADAHDALRKLNNEKLDLVLTDVNIPVIDLLQQLRDNPNSKFTPVALLVDKSDEARKKSKTTGINLWIEKPFTPTTLLDGVKKFI